MPRYFLEVAYKGTNYSGFQVQENANSIQAEVENALHLFFRNPIELTGSSRTDTGVHALQNFFHFDFDETVERKFLYNINSILPGDIVLKNVYEVNENDNCRFSAISREYHYTIYHSKNPFLQDFGWFYPYQMNTELLHEAAKVLLKYQNFQSFSKRNTQVTNFNCQLLESYWTIEQDRIVYHVKGNRFLRGMVRGLVGTMVRVGRGLISIEQFHQIIQSQDCTQADFTTPAQGLFLVQVNYPEDLLLKKL
jgi:tRNA pseudouridine38-40 synthase